MYADEPRPRGLARRGDRPKVGGVRGGRQPSRWSVAPFPCPWVPWAGGGRGTRGDAPPAPDAVAHPTPPRYAPVGGPHPPPTTARSRIFWFFLGVCCGSTGVLRLCCVCCGCVTVCFCSYLQGFAGRGFVAGRSGWCLCWRLVALLLPPRFARWVDASTSFLVSRPLPLWVELAVVLPPQFGLVASGCRSRRVRWTTFAICVVWKRCSSSSVQRGLPTSPCVTGPHAIGLGLMPVSVQAVVVGCVPVGHLKLSHRRCRQTMTVIKVTVGS